MALERFRSGGARGIARFLSDHQHCDAGFDVRREAGAGAGRLSITCKGCGEGITYKAAEAGELAAGPQLTNGDGLAAKAELPAPPAPPRTAPEHSSPGPGGAKPRKRVGTEPVAGGRGRLPGWVPTALIGLVIAAGLVMIAIGLTRSSDGSEEAPEAAAPSAQTEPAQTETAPPPAETTAPEAAAPAPAEPAGTIPADERAAAKQGLRRRTFERRFAIGVPAGWRIGNRDESISFSSAGRVAEIRIFFEPGGEPLGRMAQGADRFLAGEHEDADIGAPQGLRLGRSEGLVVRATYGGGREDAVVLVKSGYSYLILVRVDDGASTAVAAQADAAIDSFRAR